MKGAPFCHGYSLLIDYDMHINNPTLLRGSQRELARASIMMSAVPCIATLMTLREVSTAQHDGRDAPRAMGRILLQNKLSLAYWGKLTVKNETGEAIYIREYGNLNMRQLCTKLVHDSG